MADAASKAVDKELYNTWDRGSSLLGLITDKGPLARGGDSYDLPYKAAFVVNTTETAGPSATSAIVKPVSVNRPKFINQAVTKAQYAQLLGGGGKFAAEVARGGGGDLMNAIEKDIIDNLIEDPAFASGALTFHSNVAGAALTQAHVNSVEAAVREQDGIANSNQGLFWLISPRAQAAVKGVSGFISQTITDVQNKVGLPMIGMLNGINAFLHNGVPGAVNRHAKQCTASNIATNVCTATFSEGHGYVAGELIYTTGFLAGNIAVASPVAITSVTPTTVVFNQTAGNGSNGTGTIISATSMAMLCYGPWITYATDGVIPDVSFVERTDAAGWVAKIFHHLGRGSLPGSVGIVHCDDGV